MLTMEVQPLTYFFIEGSAQPAVLVADSTTERFEDAMAKYGLILSGPNGPDQSDPNIEPAPEMLTEPDEPIIIESVLSDGANIRRCSDLAVEKFHAGQVTIDVGLVFSKALAGTMYTWIGGTVTAGDETYDGACIAESVLRAGVGQNMTPMPSSEALEEQLRIRAVPALEQLIEKWENGEGQKAGVVEIPDGFLGSASVPESRYEATVERMLVAASQAGIEGATMVVVSRGVGENTVYFPMMRTQDGGVLLFRTDEGELKTVIPANRGATPVPLPDLGNDSVRLAADMTENGPQYVGLNENGFPRYRFNVESGQWDEVEVPEINYWDESIRFIDRSASSSTPMQLMEPGLRYDFLGTYQIIGNVRGIKLGGVVDGDDHVNYVQVDVGSDVVVNIILEDWVGVMTAVFDLEGRPMFRRHDEARIATASEVIDYFLRNPGIPIVAEGYNPGSLEMVLEPLRSECSAGCSDVRGFLVGPANRTRQITFRLEGLRPGSVFYMASIIRIPDFPK